MTFPLTEEQQQLRDVVRGWFAQNYSLAEVRKAFEGKRGCLTLSELGELGLEGSFNCHHHASGRTESLSAESLSPEELGLHELALVAFECGYALAPAAIHLGLFVDQRNEMDPTEVGIPDSAIRFVSAAPVAGVEPLTAIDRTQAIIVVPDARSALRAFQSILFSNECAGVCARVVEMTREYVATRKQFGKAIGTFQAVQHKLADLFLFSEMVRTTAGFAAWAYDHSPSQVELSAAAARSIAYQHTASVVEGCIQLHGGIGFTWEHDLHLFLRRAKLLEAILKPDAATREVLLAV